MSVSPHQPRPLLGPSTHQLVGRAISPLRRVVRRRNVAVTKKKFSSLYPLHAYGIDTGAHLHACEQRSALCCSEYRMGCSTHALLGGDGRLFCLVRVYINVRGAVPNPNTPRVQIITMCHNYLMAYCNCHFCVSVGDF